MRLSCLQIGFIVLLISSQCFSQSTCPVVFKESLSVPSGISAVVEAWRSPDTTVTLIEPTKLQLQALQNAIQSERLDIPGNFADAARERARGIWIHCGLIIGVFGFSEALIRTVSYFDPYMRFVVANSAVCAAEDTHHKVAHLIYAFNWYMQWAALGSVAVGGAILGDMLLRKMTTAPAPPALSPLHWLSLKPARQWLVGLKNVLGSAKIRSASILAPPDYAAALRRALQRDGFRLEGVTRE